jgi:hypothetical protein
MHASIAGMMERAGVEVTIMHAGKHKADGNPYQALGHLARHQMTGEIDRLYSDFCAHVAKHRPLDNQAVRATEARVFYGRGAVDAKLADKVMSFDELLAHVRNGQTASRGKPSRGGRMSNNQTPAAGRPDYESVIAASLATIAANQQPRQADPAPAAAAAPAPAAAAAPAAAPVDAAKAERERIGAIIGSEDGKKRPGLANHLAFETEMSAEAAGKILAAAPVEHVAAAAPTQAAGLATALEQRMAQTGNSGGIVPAAASTATARKSFSQIAAETAGRK